MPREAKRRPMSTDLGRRPLRIRRLSADEPGEKIVSLKEEIMGMWTRHRQRQAGKYAKKAYELQEREARAQQARPQSVQPVYAQGRRPVPVRHPQVHAPVQPQPVYTQVQSREFEEYWHAQGRRHALLEPAYQPRNAAEYAVFMRGYDSAKSELDAASA